MKDAAQKESIYKHFRAQRWYAVLEVPVFHRQEAQGQRKLITDIDVLGFAPTPDLRWQLIIGDCKTKKSESPANRSLWLAGLMKILSADRGILLLKKSRVEADHRLFAKSLRISLVEENEFPIYDRALVYPSGSENHPESSQFTLDLLNQVRQRFRGLSSYCDHITNWAWEEPDHGSLIRSTIGNARAIAKEIDPSKPEHLALVIEGASVFAVALATCIGKVFHQFLAPNSPEILDKALKVTIWGGQAQYEYISEVRRRLVEARGNIEPDELALPKWSAFRELIRNNLEAPHLAFLVPDLLRRSSLAIFRDREFLSDAPASDLLAIKFAMLCAQYYVDAAGMPSEIRNRIREPFLRKMSELASPAQSAKQLPLNAYSSKPTT